MVTIAETLSGHLATISPETPAAPMSARRSVYNTIALRRQAAVLGLCVLLVYMYSANFLRTPTTFEEPVITPQRPVTPAPEDAPASATAQERKEIYTALLRSSSRTGTQRAVLRRKLHNIRLVNFANSNATALAPTKEEVLDISSDDSSDEGSDEEETHRRLPVRKNPSIYLRHKQLATEQLTLGVFQEFMETSTTDDIQKPSLNTYAEPAPESDEPFGLPVEAAVESEFEAKSTPETDVKVQSEEETLNSPKLAFSSQTILFAEDALSKLAESTSKCSRPLLASHSSLEKRSSESILHGDYHSPHTPKLSQSKKSKYHRTSSSDASTVTTSLREKRSNGSRHKRSTKTPRKKSKDGKEPTSSPRGSGRLSPESPGSSASVSPRTDFIQPASPPTIRRLPEAALSSNSVIANLLRRKAELLSRIPPPHDSD